jgi:predicted  nucleic acid-binding Zn-ribbon protein
MELDAVQPPPQQPVNRHRDRRAVEPAVGEAPSDEIVATLEEKLSQARARQMAISGERKTVSLAAHMGSEGDRARLDQLNHDGAILLGEIESIEAAIAEVQARIANANAAAALEAERQKREATVKLADELREHAEKIDSLWRESIEEYLVLQGKLHDIAQSGVGRPSRHQVQSACRRALISAFIGTPLQLELLAPGERHKVTDLVASWARNV